MVFKVDFKSGKAVTWEKDDGKISRTGDPDYRPRFFLESSKSDLIKIRTWISRQESVTATKLEKHHTSLESQEKSHVLRIDTLPGKLKKTAHHIRKNTRTGKYRLYNVDLSPQFRYCMQEKINPSQKNLEKINLNIPENKLAEKTLSGIKINEEKFSDEFKALNTLRDRLKGNDPDVIILNHGDLIALIHDKIEEYGMTFDLGRRPGYTQLAGENSYDSFGKTQFGASRYNIPGRVLIDKSNSFMWSHGGLEGMNWLVEKSWKPLQELAWGSIGNILTAIEIREAEKRDVLVPWNKWRPEEFKTMDTLHSSDRGGFIFDPEVGVHENVWEVDFSSMFPNIMIEYGISPENLGCSCCSNSQVPELEYSVCQEKPGFLHDVLKPLVNARDKMKDEIKNSEGERPDLEARRDAIKWILVSCFGYQSYKNAKFGRIECHEAINAHSRDIMLQAKEKFERNGYRVVHGIIDSMWIEKKNETAEKTVDQICREVTEEVDIRLEKEAKFDWIAFVPRKNSNVGALNRYFGKSKSGDFKLRGIQARQKSTCRLVEKFQRELLQVFEPGKPGRILDKAEKKISKIKNEEIDQENLLITKQASKTLEQYKVSNRITSALRRAKFNGVNIRAGQEVTFLVRNDDSPPLNRVRLNFELENSETLYDKNFYTERVVDAVYTVLAPLGWTREEVEGKIKGSGKRKLASYMNQ